MSRWLTWFDCPFMGRLHMVYPIGHHKRTLYETVRHRARFMDSDLAFR